MPSAFTTDRIRNVVVVGHGGSGKTTLIDACAAVSGTVRRHGSAEDGTALTMFTPEEIAHGISTQVAVAHAEWMETKINLLDTPGYLDFTGEMRAGVRVADAAILTISAQDGVEVGTERVWRMLEERHLPTIVFVTGMDRPNADFEAVFQDIRDHLIPNAIPVEIPIGAGDGFRGIVNLFSERAHLYREETERGEYQEADVPEEMRGMESSYYEQLIETIAATDDVLIEHYLEGEEITREEAIHALKQAMLDGTLVPVFCGAATKTWGIRALLSKIVELFPSPAERPAQTAEGRRVPVDLRNQNTDPFCALVFKTTSEPHVGELSYFRIFGGSLRNGQEVLNAARDARERLAHLSVPQGKERVEVEMLHAGDIGVVAKLRDTHTNDTLSAVEHPLILRDGIRIPEPDVAVAVEATARGDEERLAVGLHKLHEEDPAFIAEYMPEVRQTIARGLGELHLEIQLERLRRKHGVEVETGPPRIAYRETIRREAAGHGRHKKQTGGRGQFGDCHIRLRPLPRGEGYRFVDAIVGGAIPGKYVPAVDKGIQEAAQRGVVAGFPLVDFEAECHDGSYHTVDSSEQAFRAAGALAFQSAVADADPAVLEPILEVEAVTPEEHLGDVIGDLNQRRGRILGMETTGNLQRVRALVPEAELYRYATTLRSITQGRGTHTRTFHGYEEMPRQEAEKLAGAARQAS